MTKEMKAQRGRKTRCAGRKPHCVARKIYGCEATGAASSKVLFNFEELAQKKEYRKFLHSTYNIKVTRNRKICELCTSKLRRLLQKKQVQYYISYFLKITYKYLDSLF
jgi:hypothetical protein